MKKKITEKDELMADLIFAQREIRRLRAVLMNVQQSLHHQGVVEAQRQITDALR